MNNGEEYFESWTYSTKMYKASYKKKKENSGCCSDDINEM